MKRKLALLGGLATLMLSFSAQVHAEEWKLKGIFKVGEKPSGQMILTMNGEAPPTSNMWVEEAYPYIKNGTMFVPMRAVANQIGISPGEIKWDAKTKTVTIESNWYEGKIILKIGDKTMKKGDKTILLSHAPEIKEGRIMLPLRDVSEALECKIVWNQELQQAECYMDYDAIEERLKAKLQEDIEYNEETPEEPEHDLVDLETPVILPYPNY